MNKRMNFSSFLMIVIFVVIGYVIHPIVLPFVEDNLPKAASSQKNELEEVEAPKDEVKVVPVTPEEPVVPKVIVDPAVETIPPNVEVVAEEEVPEVEIPEVEVPEVNVKMSDAGVVAAMQKSVKAKEVNEFSYDDVQAWEFSGEEDIEGSSYGVGVATVEVTSILGSRERKVKALCKNGKVDRWIWAASGVEIE